MSVDAFAFGLSDPVANELPEKSVLSKLPFEVLLELGVNLGVVTERTNSTDHVLKQLRQVQKKTDLSPYTHSHLRELCERLGVELSPGKQVNIVKALEAYKKDIRKISAVTITIWCQSHVKALSDAGHNYNAATTDTADFDHVQDVTVNTDLQATNAESIHETVEHTHIEPVIAVEDDTGELSGSKTDNANGVTLEDSDVVVEAPANLGSGVTDEVDDDPLHRLDTDNMYNTDDVHEFVPDIPYPTVPPATSTVTDRKGKKVIRDPPSSSSVLHGNSVPHQPIEPVHLQNLQSDMLEREPTMLERFYQWQRSMTGGPNTGSRAETTYPKNKFSTTSLGHHDVPSNPAASVNKPLAPKMPTRADKLVSTGTSAVAHSVNNHVEKIHSRHVQEPIEIVIPPRNIAERPTRRLSRAAPVVTNSEPRSSRRDARIVSSPWSASDTLPMQRPITLHRRDVTSETGTSRLETPQPPTRTVNSAKKPSATLPNPKPVTPRRQSTQRPGRAISQATKPEPHRSVRNVPNMSSIRPVAGTQPNARAGPSRQQPAIPQQHRRTNPPELSHFEPQAQPSQHVTSNMGTFSSQVDWTAYHAQIEEICHRAESKFLIRAGAPHSVRGGTAGHLSEFMSEYLLEAGKALAMEFEKAFLVIHDRTSDTEDDSGREQNEIIRDGRGETDDLYF